MNTKIESFKKYLASIGINPNKTYGQNFLIDDYVLQDIVDAAEVSKEDIVVEVGPGIGTLTKLLAERAKNVLAIEKDLQFKPILKRLERKYKNLRVVYADILGVNLENELSEKKYKVVANIPYYITGKIIQYFLRAKTHPESLTMLVQKEVAQNIIAQPGKLGLLGISVQLVGEGRVVRDVPKESFYPSPKVTSTVIQINANSKNKYSDIDERKFFKILHAAFLGKRKQLHNTLESNLLLSKEDVRVVLEKSKIQKTARPQELSLDDWVRILHEVEKIKIDF